MQILTCCTSFLFWLLFTVFLLWPSFNVSANDDIKSIMKKWQAGREQLRYFECESTGEVSQMNEKGEATSNTRFTIESAFDAVNEKSKHNVIWGKENGVWVRLTDTILQRANSRDAQISTIDSNDNDKTMPFVKQIDPRIIGMLPDGNGWGSRKILEDIKKDLETMVQFLELIEKEDNKIEIVFTAPVSEESADSQQIGAKLSFVLDITKIYVPCEYNLSLRFPNYDFDIPQASCKVDYENKDGVWVPIWVEHSDAMRREKASFSIKWKSINKSLDKSLFEPEGMGAPDGTLVTDLRINADGKYPIVTQKIGDPNFTPGFENRMPTGASDIPLRSSGYVRLIFIISGVLLILLSIGLKLKRYFDK